MLATEVSVADHDDDHTHDVVEEAGHTHKVFPKAGIDLVFTDPAGMQVDSITAMLPAPPQSVLGRAITYKSSAGTEVLVFVNPGVA